MRELKIRKNIMITKEINRRLEEISIKTNHSQSEIIAIALMNLDESFIPKKITLEEISKKINMNKQEIINAVLLSIEK